MYTLGIWDGHDSGAALLKGDKILFAINEERLTRRKLEVAFPQNSIEACLTYCNLAPEDINHIAISTYDFAKTLARLFPSFKEEYYLIRRRKKMPKGFTYLKKKVKYKLTEYKPNGFYEFISKLVVAKKLKQLGFGDFQLLFLNHHLCHAASAAFCSGFDECIVLTIDGIGDGLSGTISTFRDNKLNLISSISGKDSFGIFFEHVTNLMNMRELEDEGKVMALANYAYPIDDEDNPLMDFFRVEGLNIKAKYSTLQIYDRLKKILWKYPSEQFAYMAQRVLEAKIVELVENITKDTALRKIALSGGVFSNIKVNMKIKDHPQIEDCFVFPHMGDGGLALGAAMLANYELNSISSYNLSDLYLGLEYTDEEIKNTLEKHTLHFTQVKDIWKEVAQLITQGSIVLWFQGRMEAGPRALGARSIVAMSDSEKIKDNLNLKLKKRVWYQPFCPTMLDKDARDLLQNYNSRSNKFMTMAYTVREDMREVVKGVINIDGSCRPQILDSNETSYEKLLHEIKKLTGHGVILNTSFNIHGDPIVCSPEDAVKTLIKSKADYLAIGNYIVKGVE